MTKIGAIYVAGTVSTIFTLLSTVANGIFANAIARELSDLGGLQVASVTGCALSCLIQGFLIFLFRDRIKKGFRFRRKIECWLLVVVGFILCLMIVVEAMAIRWSSSRLGDIKDTVHQQEAGKLFSVWCALWAVSVCFQAACYGILIYLDQNSARTEPNWEVPSRERRSNSRQLNDEESPISPKEPPRLYLRAQEKFDSVSWPIMNMESSRFSGDPQNNGDQPNEIPKKRMSTDAHQWMKRFSRRLPGLSDELKKFDAAEREAEGSKERREFGSSNRHRASRDQSPDSLFQRPVIPDARSIIRTPSPALSIAGSIHGDSDVSQDRIHPLFRCDSPSARPFVSPGTNVTASPLAGQTVSIAVVNRIRSRSSLARPRSRSFMGHLNEGGEGEEEREQDVDTDEDERWRASVNGLQRPAPGGYPSSIYGSGRAYGSHTSLHDHGHHRMSSVGQARSGRGSSMSPCR